MTTIESVREMFARNIKEYREFDRVVQKRSQRPDLHAFLMVDELVGGDDPLIATTQAGTVYLNVVASDLAKAGVSEDVVIELLRCGVVLDHGSDWLCL